MEVGAYQGVSANLSYQKASLQGTFKTQNGNEQNFQIDAQSISLQFQAESAGFADNQSLVQSILGQGADFLNSFFGGQTQDEPEQFDYNKINDILNNVDTDKIGYTGKKLTDLTPEEAGDLVSENGFFGVTNTSDRVAQFVISGAGNDLEKLQAGREGILKGFNDAESTWGSTLPDIAYQTQERTLKLIDERIAELGGNVLDSEA